MIKDLLKVAFEYYRKEYPNRFIAFHKGNKYYVCFAPRDCKINAEDDMGYLEFECESFELLQTFSASKTPLQIIEYKNDSWENDIPDINLIKKEKSYDY